MSLFLTVSCDTVQNHEGNMSLFFHLLFFCQLLPLPLVNYLPVDEEPALTPPSPHTALLTFYRRQAKNAPLTSHFPPIIGPPFTFTMICSTGVYF